MLRQDADVACMFFVVSYVVGQPRIALSPQAGGVGFWGTCSGLSGYPRAYMYIATAALRRI